MALIGPTRPVDRLGRALGNLRLSVTDRCNLRCTYCMPEEEYVWLPKADILSFEELSSLVDVFLDLGVEKVRVTGGEPLQRADLPTLIRLLAEKPRLRDLSLTTNGVLLASRAGDLRRAGLHRLTVSLDTLREDRFLALAGRPHLPQVLAGIRAAIDAGFSPLKLDSVLIRGENDDEIGDLVAFAREIGAEIRFIEYMDVGGATRWAPHKVFSRADMLAALAAAPGPIGGPIEPLPGRGTAPAERFRLADGTVIGIIASTTAPFCRDCDRGRITADGTWYQCLYAHRGLDLRALLRGGKSSTEIADALRAAWGARADRGAEDRLAQGDRGPILPASMLKRDPRLEMHTRGG
ncbi:MAG: GTP 3',8-cyclase MoaA [Byssovorax sp.]